jgi:protein-disulfide isomerase
MVAVLRNLLMVAIAATPAFAQARGGGVSVAGLGHDVGVETAKVMIVEFGDFGCGYCAKFNTETFPKIDAAYIKTGVVRWKMVPYVNGMFRHSREVSEAAECAAEQGAFWKMNDLLYAKKKEWTTTKDIRALTSKYATQLKLNSATFARCLMNPEIGARIARNTAIAQQLNIRGTPTFFVNGRIVPGAIPFELFQQVIADAAR